MIYSGLGVAAVILLEAFPVYKILVSEYFGHTFRAVDYFFVGGGLVGAFAISVLMIVYPMRAGLKSIDGLEI